MRNEVTALRLFKLQFFLWKVTKRFTSFSLAPRKPPMVSAPVVTRSPLSFCVSLSSASHMLPDFDALSDHTAAVRAGCVERQLRL